MQKKTLYLIDGTALAYRAHYAHQKNPLQNAKGEPTSVIFGVLHAIILLLEKQNPDYIGIAFDLSGPTFRHTLDPQYKANRSKTPDELKQQLPKLKKILTAMGLTILQKEGFEADDVIGSLAIQGAQENMDVWIVSNDKDFAQLVNENIQLLSHGSLSSTQKKTDTNGVIDKFGLHPSQIIDYLALVGDTSDNIKGVPKVGPKTAHKLLTQFESLESLYKNIDEVTPLSLQKRLKEHKESAFLSQKLATISTSIEDLPPIEELKKGHTHEEEVKADLERYGLSSIKKRLFTSSAERISFQPSQFLLNDRPTIQHFCNTLSKSDRVIIHSLLRPQPDEEPFLALAFSITPHEVFFLPLLQSQTKHQPLQLSLIETPEPSSIGQKEIFALLQPHLESPTLQKVGHDLKTLAIAFSQIGIHLQGIEFDTLLSCHLLDPSQTKNDLAFFALKHLNASKQDASDLLGSGRKKQTWVDLKSDIIQAYLSEEVEIIHQLWLKTKPHLETFSLDFLMNNIEIPLLSVLVQLEQQGIALDHDFLNKMNEDLSQELELIHQNIMKWADDPSFNANSSQQIATLLYDKLQLPEKLGIKIKKTSKGSLTTNSAALESLSEHELPRLLLEYRMRQKLKSTYLEALPTHSILDRSGVYKIHTHLHQTGTSTGRLSSSSPNLQNIPIRTPLGRKIRQAFVCSQPKWIFLSADYSQVELRILAHMSQDPELRKAFHEQIDIHARTASLVFQTPLSNITKEQRNTAKAINFGIIYGMGATRLAQQIDVSNKKANAFIKAYFASYPSVRDYLDQTIEFAKTNGYVETILGRKRYIDHLHSEDGRLRSAAENIAVNTPIQGSAADLIKKAMINVSNALTEQHYEAKMLLQIHDELLFEAPEKEADSLSELLKQEMSSALSLDVSLVVDIGSGQNWAEAH